MTNKLLPASIAACIVLTLTFALSLETATAHEPRDIEDYNLVVGFLHEPAFEGILNGVYLSVTKVAEHGHGDPSASSDHHAAPKAHDAIESEVPVSVDLTAEVDDSGGVDIQIATEGWLWTPENVDGEHVPGEGHAHIYVNDVKIGRVYGPTYELEGLQPGERQVRVTLNSNSHDELTYDGKAVEATAMVTIPDTGHHASQAESEDTADSEGGHSHGAEMIAGVTGLEQTILVEVTHIPSGAKRNMTLHAFDEPGNYKSDFIPTASGQYVFHFIGTIEGMLLNERFESGVGTFDDVQPATAIQFPESAASTRELESAVRGALESARQAQDTALALESAANSAQDNASTATTLAIAGIAVGAIGIIVGGIGITAALRRRN